MIFFHSFFVEPAFQPPTTHPSFPLTTPLRGGGGGLRPNHSEGLRPLGDVKNE